MSEDKSKDAAKKRAIDWEAVERAYRAGVLSIREIGKVHEVSDKAIRNKAKEFGWERDLSDKVNEKVRADLVRTESAPADRLTEREIVDSAAAIVVNVVRSHRKTIVRGKDLVDRLMEQVFDAAGQREDLEEAIEEETANDRSGERRAKLMRAVSLGTHSTIAVNLANAAKTWIGLERQSFGLADGDSGKGADAPVEPTGLTAEEAYRKMVEGR